MHHTDIISDIATLCLLSVGDTLAVRSRLAACIVMSGNWVRHDVRKMHAS